MTENDKLILGVETETLLKNATARESWRIFGIMSEFVEATERPPWMAHIDAPLPRCATTTRPSARLGAMRCSSPVMYS